MRKPHHAVNSIKWWEHPLSLKGIISLEILFAALWLLSPRSAVSVFFHIGAASPFILAKNHLLIGVISHYSLSWDNVYLLILSELFIVRYHILKCVNFYFLMTSTIWIKIILRNWKRSKRKKGRKERRKKEKKVGRKDTIHVINEQSKS